MRGFLTTEGTERGKETLDKLPILVCLPTLEEEVECLFGVEDFLSALPFFI
jgi:hypothetical protein